MKLGTDNKLETGIAIILVIGAVLSVAYWMNSSNPSGSTSTSNTAQKTTTAANRSLINPLDPTIRFDLLESAQGVKYAGKGRNIFRANSQPEIPKPVTPPLNPKPGPQTPTTPVVTGPPPINLKFFGVASRQGEAQRVFLSEGESIFVAREGDIVDSRYKVVKINPQSVEIEDLLNNNRQSIPLTQG